MADLANFRKSSGVDDRQDESFLQSYRQALGQMSITELLEMLQGQPSGTYQAEAPNIMPATPLGVDAGANDILSSHGTWLLRRAMGGQVHSMEDKMQPAKLPFGLSG